MKHNLVGQVAETLKNINGTKIVKDQKMETGLSGSIMFDKNILEQEIK